MSYGVHRYEGGNLAAIAAMSESARNVGAVYAHDEWRLTERFAIGYGAHYAHYDYLLQPAHFSPRLSLTYQHPHDRTRVRAVAARRVVAPGAEEFLPPAHAQVLPPQRTFGPLTRAGSTPEDLRHYEVAVEQTMDGATIGVRAFYQSVDEQLVTVFGLRDSELGNTAVGHYSVGSGGDVDLRGLGVTFSHAPMNNVRSSVEYSLAVADWPRAIAGGCSRPRRLRCALTANGFMTSPRRSKRSSPRAAPGCSFSTR
jgi:outer membrane receptor for ferrienterochelin and colicin